MLQLRAVNFRPSLNQPLLRLGQAAAKTLDRFNGEDRSMVLVIRMEMCAVVRTASFDEHPDHDPEEPRDFRHVRTIASSKSVAPG